MADETQCKADVHNDFGVSFHRCLRKAVKGGFCKQHHPDAIAKRDAERAAKWDAENRAYRAMARRQERISALKDAVIEAADSFREWQGGCEEYIFKIELLAAVDALREARK